MSKTALIIKREYKTRVMKPSFIILTFLTPILIAALVLVPLLLAQIKDDAVKKIIVIDRTGLYTKAFEDNEEYQFIFLNQDIEFFKETKIQNSYSAVLYIPEDLSVHPSLLQYFQKNRLEWR